MLFFFGSESLRTLAVIFCHIDLILALVLSLWRNLRQIIRILLNPYNDKFDWSNPDLDRFDWPIKAKKSC